MFSPVVGATPELQSPLEELRDGIRVTLLVGARFRLHVR